MNRQTIMVISINEDSLCSIEEEYHNIDRRTNKAKKGKDHSIRNKKSSKKERKKQRRKEQQRQRRRRKEGLVNQEEEEEEEDLFGLLNHPGFYVDEEAVINAVFRDPQVVKRQYSFQTFEEDCYCYPLHQAIWCRASRDVVNVLYKNYPPAVLEEDSNGESPIAMACKYGCTCCGTSPSVALYLLEQCPDALKTKDRQGNTLLHNVCHNSNTSLEIVSFLLEKWPESAKQKNNNGQTPLFLACNYNLPPEVLMMLLTAWPEAIKEKEKQNGETPLHAACLNIDSKAMILLLLEKWPEAVNERASNGLTPLNYLRIKKAPANAQKVLCYVSRLCNASIDINGAKEILHFFKKLQWAGGVALVLDRYPAIAQTLHYDMKIEPSLFSVLGHYCNILTMQELILNRQELMANIQ